MQMHTCMVHAEYGVRRARAHKARMGWRECDGYREGGGGGGGYEGGREGGRGMNSGASLSALRHLEWQWIGLSYARHTA